MSAPQGRPRFVRLAVGTSVALLGVLAGCSDAEPARSATDPCLDTMAEMAVAREIDDQVARLDRALVVCGSPAAFERAFARHEGAVGVDAATFIDRRCYDPPTPRVERSSVCRSVVTTTTSTTVPELAEVQVYLGVTLDGRQVEIRSDTTRFSEGRPVTITQLVDIGTEDGCEGVETEYRRWLINVQDPDPARSDEASVYAQHALNVLAVLGCPAPESP